MFLRQSTENEQGMRASVELLHSASVTVGDALHWGVDPLIERLVRSVVRSEMYRRRSATAEDVEDVCSDCMVSLLGRMEDLRADPVAAGNIVDFEAYVAMIARRACSAWSRRQYPAFHRLRARLRYLLNGDARFGLWTDERGDWVCGWAKWQGDGAAVEEVDVDLFEHLARDAKPAEVLAGIFERAGRPVYFNDLAKICARFWAVDDTPQTLESGDIISPAGEELESTLDRRARLKRLWTELRDLPQRQCAALLLNLRGADGECATSLLVVTGTATLRALGDAVGLSANDFAELWPRLPLSDLEIAERMQITRQQVINLRKCARERLRRRMGNE